MKTIYQRTYQQILARVGFPPDVHTAQVWQRRAMSSALETARADMGALHEAHIRDCQIIASMLFHAGSDMPPACRIPQADA